MWATQLSIVDCVIPRHRFCWGFEKWKSTSGGILCKFGSRTFPPISRMCQKQTWVSHSSTESETISLDAGLRMDGLVALDIWNMVIEVLRSANNTKTPIDLACGKRFETGDCSRNTSKPKQKANLDVQLLSHLVYVPTNAHSTQGESQLYMFEDNEAVIKMIVKGRSPTMRHVSRTHRVAIDRLFVVVWQNQSGLKNPKLISWNQEPTCRHILKKKLRRWWMESSSLFVEHYEPSDVLLQPLISFKQKAARTECHAEEGSRRNFQGKFGNGEAEIYEFGDGSRYVEYKERFSARYERFRKPREC